MIYGVGVDIVDIRRIDALLNKFGDHFLNRYYTQQEIDFCSSRKRISSSLAKMFAIKEAVIKAISAPRYLKWHDIEIVHKLNGKPEVILHGYAQSELKCDTAIINISTSDEYPYAIAFAMISCRQ